MEDDLACRLGLTQLCGDSPALCQFLLLVHHTAATSDTNPPTRCATSTLVQRAVGTLLEAMPCICCSHSRCPTTSHAHEPVCYHIPRSQRITPGLQKAGLGEVVPHFFLLPCQATTRSTPRPSAGVRGLP